jgi:hypothetical protein
LKFSRKICHLLSLTTLSINNLSTAPFVNVIGLLLNTITLKVHEIDLGSLERQLDGKGIIT